MKLRNASLLDFTRIEQIHREAEARFSTIPPPARLWALVSQTLTALLPLSQETMLYVAEERGRVVGFVQASGRPLTLRLPAKATTLQILNLCVANDADEREVAPRLVQHLCEQAGRNGVSRLFVRVPLDDPLLSIFRVEGFRQYATEQVVYAERPRPRSDQYPDGLRPGKRSDDRHLYQLYRKVTPQGVSQLEAPTYREWKAIHAGESTGSYVVDRIEVVGWVRMQRGGGARPDTLQFMALPENPLPAELADFGISLLGDSEAPAWSSLRHYDSHMIDALRGRGFTVLLTQLLLVKELAVRVPKPVREKGLVPSFG